MLHNQMISPVQQQYPFCLFSFMQKGQTSEPRVMQSMGFKVNSPKL